MLSTPAMNVVATAPSPGVSMPSRPVAGAIDLGASLEDDLPNFYLRLYLRLCAARTRDSRGFRGGRGIIDPSDRLCIEVPRKAMHECDPLYRRDPRSHREKNYYADQHPAVPEKPEQRLGRREKYDALGTLHDANLRVDPKRFRAGKPPSCRRCGARGWWHRTRLDRPSERHRPHGQGSNRRTLRKPSSARFSSLL